MVVKLSGEPVRDSLYVNERWYNKPVLSKGGSLVVCCDIPDAKVYLNAERSAGKPIFLGQDSALNLDSKGNGILFFFGQ